MTISHSSLLTILAFSATLAACGQKDENPIKTTPPVSGTTTGTTTPSVQATAPAAPTDRESAPAPTPSTHAGAPQPADTSTAAAPTARDTPAQRPEGTLTPAEESKSMPKPGQTDNHFTTATDGSLKGTQQSSGSPGTGSASSGPTQPAGAAGSTIHPTPAPAAPAPVSK